MEVVVALELFIDLHDNSGYYIFVEAIVSNDNSTMRAHISHTIEGGKQPYHITDPQFLVDPSHCIKVMASSFFKLVQAKTKDPKIYKKINAMRLKNTSGASSIKTITYRSMNLWRNSRRLLNICSTATIDVNKSGTGQNKWMTNNSTSLQLT